MTNRLLLTRICLRVAVVATDEERKAIQAGPTVTELRKKQKEAQKHKPRTCRDQDAFKTYIFRVLKQLNTGEETPDGQQAASG